jgi:Mannosyltransferase (PIG-V)
VPARAPSTGRWRRAGKDGEAAPAVRAFWTFVGIRLAFWVGLALVFVAYPYPLPPGTPRYEVFDWRTRVLFNVFARWDTTWFLGIAEHGYRTVKQAAFFPLYPLLVHALGYVTRSDLVAGVLLSLAAGGAAAVFLREIGLRFASERVAWDAILYLALFPISFVFTAVYSDALFLALSTGAVLAGLRNRPFLAGVAGGLAVATRLVGIALLPALVILLWSQRRSLRRLAPLMLLPAALGAVALYLGWKLGDAGVLWHAQSHFWGRHLATVGPLGGLWDATSAAATGSYDMLRSGDPEGTLNVIYFLLLVAALALTWVVWRSFGAALAVYSLTYLAIVLSVPGRDLPLVSFPRFFILDFPLILALAKLTIDRPRERQILLCTFAALGALAAFGFARNAWIA